MNWKLIVVGGIALYIVMFAVGMGVGGPLIHDGVLKADYDANPQFWRPELRTDPPDMAGLMPRWIIGGLLSSLVLASIYGPATASGPCSPNGFVASTWKGGFPGERLRGRS